MATFGILYVSRDANHAVMELDVRLEVELLGIVTELLHIFLCGVWLVRKPIVWGHRYLH